MDLRQQKMKEKLKAYWKFEKYLTQVLDNMPEGKLMFICFHYFHCFVHNEHDFDFLSKLC